MSAKLCANCTRPIVETAGVWRHEIASRPPMLTRWCVDEAGWYIWPTTHASPVVDQLLEPVRADNEYSVNLDGDSE